jgi:thiol-disulfide isomerase/thioredoxin
MVVNTMEKAPMLIFVVAAWCPHCVTFMPKLIQAALGPRNVNVALVESEKLPTLNAALEKRNKQPETISVTSYPTGLAVTPELTRPNHSASPSPISTEINNVKQYMNAANIGENNKQNAAISHTRAKHQTTTSPSAVANEGVGESANIEDGQNSKKGAKVPLVKSPVDFAETRSAPYTYGGGLLTAMSHTAYTLAPTAVLLATAATIMKGTRKGRKGKKTHRKTRRALRNRR